MNDQFFAWEGWIGFLLMILMHIWTVISLDRLIERKQRENRLLEEKLRRADFIAKVTE